MHCGESNLNVLDVSAGYRLGDSGDDASDIDDGLGGDAFCKLEHRLGHASTLAQHRLHREACMAQHKERALALGTQLVDAGTQLDGLANQCSIVQQVLHLCPHRLGHAGRLNQRQVTEQGIVAPSTGLGLGLVKSTRQQSKNEKRTQKVAVSKRVLVGGSGCFGSVISV